MTAGRPFDYDAARISYSRQRREEPAIAARIRDALGAAGTVLNVGAGTGSYEPGDRFVVAVEPSGRMRGQRLELGRTPAVDARAEALPFDDGSFDAVMALVTVHHWPDIEQGLAELSRVARDRVVVMTFDPDRIGLFWNTEYFPEVAAIERQRFPAIWTVVAALGGRAEVSRVPIPASCVDGFQEAYFARPEAFLDPEVRASQSAWGFVDPAVTEQRLSVLADELESGRWDEKHGQWRTADNYDGSLTIVVAHVV